MMRMGGRRSISRIDIHTVADDRLVSVRIPVLIVS